MSSSRNLPAKRRPISPYQWGGVNHSITSEIEKLPPDSPRIKPTLPRLKFLDEPDLDREGGSR